MLDVELVHVVRGARVDCIHRGRLALTDTAGQVVYAAGDPAALVYLRSCTKPFQALAALRSGAADQFGFTDEELALMAGSHNGTPEHTRLAAGILAKIGASPDDLQCGVGIPLSQEAYQKLLLSGHQPTALEHNCSGKHSGMLAACRAQGWDLATYRAWDHPVQVLIREIVAEFAGLPADSIHLAHDGCGVPTFGLPLRNLAQMFAHLGASAQDPNSDLGRIARAMQQYPLIFSGHKRIDAALVIGTGGRLIAKGGAEGALGVSIPQHGLGIALKTSDGNQRAHLPALIALLLDRGYISADEAAAIDALMPAAITIHTGDQAGEIKPVLPLK
jgi:L-asparaginase II